MANQNPILTRPIPFFQCGGTGHELFSVQRNVPAAEALVWASCLLDSVMGLLKDTDDQSHKDHACLVMVEMAKAVVDAVEVGNV